MTPGEPARGTFFFVSSFLKRHGSSLIMHRSGIPLHREFTNNIINRQFTAAFTHGRKHVLTVVYNKKERFNDSVVSVAR
jgi:hypothetical protein